MQKSKVELSKFDSTSGLNRGASTVKEILWYIFKVLFFLTAIPFPSKIKSFILKSFGATVGKDVVIKPRVNIHFPWKLDIGNNVWIGEEVFILNFEGCKIGSNVCISQRAFICGGNHDYRVSHMPYRNGKIILEDGCWVGACVFIGPNVTIGMDTIITAGSIISKSLAANSVYKGAITEIIGKRWRD